MSEPFEYALLRAVPRADRGECINVGVLLYCQAASFLGLAAEVDAERLRGLDPHADLDAVVAAVDGVRQVCADASWPVRERFGWLTAPRSTVLRTSPVHCGVTDDPAATMQRLFARLVLPPR